MLSVVRALVLESLWPGYGRRKTVVQQIIIMLILHGGDNVLLFFMEVYRRIRVKCLGGKGQATTEFIWEELKKLFRARKYVKATQNELSLFYIGSL